MMNFQVNLLCHLKIPDFFLTYSEILQIFEIKIMDFP
jgi:hypothetical protein